MKRIHPPKFLLTQKFWRVNTNEHGTELAGHLFVRRGGFVD